MDPNFILGLTALCGSAFWFLPKLMLAASDRVSAEKKELTEKFSQVYSRLDHGDRERLMLKAMIDSNQSAITHRIEMQDQRIGLNLESIMTQMQILSKQLDEIKHQLTERPLKY